MAIVSVSRTSITDEGRSRSLIAASPAEVLGGMVLITPTSIASTGTGNSSSIGANGSVTFSSCATLSLNGVFSATYDNYMISYRSLTSTSANHAFRMRVGGVDESSASNYYTYQYLQASSTTISASRTTTTFAVVNAGTGTQRDGTTIYIYGPFLAQPTAGRSITEYDASSASIFDNAFTHSLSTSYDGFSLYPSTGSFTGLVSVYGLKGA